MNHDIRVAVKLLSYLLGGNVADIGGQLYCIRNKNSESDVRILDVGEMTLVGLIELSKHLEGAEKVKIMNWRNNE